MGMAMPLSGGPWSIGAHTILDMSTGAWTGTDRQRSQLLTLDTLPNQAETERPHTGRCFENVVPSF